MLFRSVYAIAMDVTGISDKEIMAVFEDVSIVIITYEYLPINMLVPAHIPRLFLTKTRVA